uniref:Uncharacterized protein n=1 Tax=Nelumbo nucifera TaxID=4432 RepID=A0A822YGU1_NELNU|nr:TPA_asm: hypothetical protein HUJ06_010204 [Nelumbo nucifera]
MMIMMMRQTILTVYHYRFTAHVHRQIGGKAEDLERVKWQSSYCNSHAMDGEFITNHPIHRIEGLCNHVDYELGDLHIGTHICRSSPQHAHESL